MKKATILLVTLMVLSFLGCNKGSIITGVVLDTMSGEPVSEAYISVYAEINIKEDKKYEGFSTTTNSSGEFTVKGLSDKYRYSLLTYKEGYNFNTREFQPAEKGKTLILNEPINIVRSPDFEGIYLLSNNEFINVSPTTFLQTRYPHCADYLASSTDFAHINYLNKSEMPAIIEVDNNQPLYLVLFTSASPTIRVVPITYFSTLYSCMDTGYSRSDRKSQWAPFMNDIFVSSWGGTVENRITMWSVWEDSPSLSQGVGALAYYIRNIEVLSFTSPGDNRRLIYINLSNLPNGLFCYEDKHRNTRDKYVFKIGK